MKSISDHVKAIEAELLTKRDAMTEHIKALDAAPDDDVLVAAIDDVSAQIEQLSEKLDRFRGIEKRNAVRATPVVNAPAVITQMKRDAAGDGSLLWKMATAKMIAHATRKTEAEVIEKHYGHDDRVAAAADFVHKSVVNPAMTTTTGWAAELVRTDYQGFLNTLRTVSVAAELANRSQMLSFGGFNSITVPMRNALGATLQEPSWVAEGAAIPLTQFSFGSMTLNRYKLACVTTATKEVVERSTPQVEGLLRDALSEAYAQVLDAALLSNAAAVVNVRPAGLLNGVTAATGTAGSGEAAVIADLKTAIGAMTAARLGARPVLIIPAANRLSVGLMLNPLGQRSFSDEIASGRLLGMEVISSQNVPANTAILIDAAVFATAFDTPSFDVSDVATVVESNANGTAPTMAATAAQPAIGAVGTAGQVPLNSGIAVAGSTGAATTGFQARSLWQTHSIGIKMIAPTSWGLMRAGAVHVTTAITW